MPSIELQQVTRHGAEMYLEMIFHHGFYHGDPHPGNLVVLPDGAIGLLDFGMVARLDERLREDIEDMLIAIVSQDSQQLTSLVMRLGSVPPGLDEPALSVDLAEFVNHYANQPVDAFDLAGALTEMIEIIQRYRIVLPPSLAMLIKVLVMLEGTARMLQPNFSLMELIAAVSEEDAAAAVIAGAANAEGAADLFRGGKAGRGAAATAARYFAAGRERQVRRPPRSPRAGAERESAGAGAVDELALSGLVAADQPARVGVSRRVGSRHAGRHVQRLLGLAAAAGDRQIGPARSAKVAR